MMSNIFDIIPFLKGRAKIIDRCKTTALVLLSNITQACQWFDKRQQVVVGVNCLVVIKWQNKHNLNDPKILSRFMYVSDY